MKSELGKLRRHYIIGISLFGRRWFYYVVYVAGFPFSANYELLLLTKHGILLDSFVVAALGKVCMLATTRRQTRIA